MQIRCVRIVKNKSLVRVAVVVAFYAFAGNVCWAQRAVKEAEPITSQFVACVEICHDPTCVSGCIANVGFPVGNVFRGRTPKGASVNECFTEVADNITLCGRVFLVPFEDADMETFWFCEAMATMRFSLCPAFEASYYPDATVKLGRYCLDRTIELAGYTIDSAQVGLLDPLPAHSPDGSNVEVQSRKKSDAARMQGISPVPIIIFASFGDCLNDFASNHDACDKTFPGNSDSDKDGRKTCYKVASESFSKCVKIRSHPRTDRG